MARIADKARDDKAREELRARARIEAWLEKNAKRRSDIEREEMADAALDRWKAEGKVSPERYAKRALGDTSRRANRRRTEADAEAGANVALSPFDHAELPEEHLVALERVRAGEDLKTVMRDTERDQARARRAKTKSSREKAEETKHPDLAKLHMVTWRTCVLWAVEHEIRRVVPAPREPSPVEREARRLFEGLRSTLAELDALSRRKGEGQCLEMLRSWAPEHVRPLLRDEDLLWREWDRLGWRAEMVRLHPHRDLARELGPTAWARLWIAAGGWPTSYPWPAKPDDIIQSERKAWQPLLR